ncbi:MAG: lysine exporter LysO family protein, partial [Thermocladium sp.]
GELYVLAGVVGLSLGSELGRGVLAAGLNGVKAVTYAVAGSILAGLLLSLLLRVPMRVSLAVALGFGWYTFDGPTVAAYAGPYLGVLAFLANFFREQLTFILVPFLPGSPASLISMGGATTMDDTLPLYASILGRQYSVTAMVNGLLLTLMVPIIVPLVLSL